MGGDLGARILAGIPAVLFAALLVSQGGWLFAIGVGLLGLICLHELFSMFHYTAPSRMAGFIGLIGMVAAAYFGDTDQVLLAFVATIPLVFLLTLVQVDGGAPGVAITILGLSWIGMGIAHAVLLRELEHGGAIVFAVLLGTFVGDTGAYLGGRAFGRTKLAPTVSPNKTVEGLVIGMVCAVLVVWWAGLSQDWFGGTKAVLLGLGVAIAAPLGDLFESFLKRNAGTKDTGRLFGAHGGALDRLDAVIFTVVVGYWVWRAFL